MKRQIRILTIVLSAVFLLCLCSCSIIDEAFSPSEIEDGFSDEWLKTLSDKYNLNIPESAIYQKGFFEPGQDFSVHMLFTVSADDFDSMIGDGWTKDAEGHSFGDEWYTDLTDKELSHYYVYSKQYTVLFFSDASEDSTITCVFVGWRP